MSFYSFDQGISTAEIPFIQPGTIALDSASPGHRLVSHFSAHHSSVIPAERLANGLTSPIHKANGTSYVRWTICQSKYWVGSPSRSSSNIKIFALTWKKRHTQPLERKNTNIICIFFNPHVFEKSAFLRQNVAFSKSLEFSLK